MQKTLSRLVYRYRRAEIVLLHLGLVLLANYLAFLLRFGGQISRRRRSRFWTGFRGCSRSAVLAFIPFRLYEGLWRYTSIWDLRSIVGGVA